MTDNDDPTDDAEESPSGRSSAGIGLAMFALLAGAAAVLFFFQSKRTEQVSTQGLDLAQAPPDQPPPMAPAPDPGTYGVAPPQSSLTAIQGAPQGMSIPGAPGSGGRPGRPSKEQAAGSLTEAVRRAESQYYQMAVRYTQKYPVFKEYGREWMSHPDLNKACKGYYEHHNPIKYAYEVAASPNLPKLVMKYARKPEMQSFIKEAAMSAPKDIMTGLNDYLKADGNAMALVKKFAASAGIPPALLAGFTGGQVDQQQVMSQIMSGNPELQNAMQNQPGVPPAR